jgi:hypothetical protein
VSRDARERRVGGRPGELEVVRPQPEDHAAGQPPAVAQGDPAGAEARLAALHLRLDEVHRGRADERRDEQVRRVREQRLRRVALLQHAAAHDRDAVAERHRLDLVVRHVDRRDAEPLVQPAQLRPHRDAQLGVEVRQRLVHQERGRLARDRAAHRDALALTARERGGLAVQQLVEPEDPRDLLDAACDLALGRPAQLQAEAEVAAHAQVRIERVALEHHRDVALARVQPRDVAVADVDRALRDLDDPRQHLQHRRLAAARRSDEHHELPVADLEVDMVDGERAVLVALRQSLDADRRHRSPSSCA